VETAKMGTPLRARGSRKEARTPVSSNGNGPSSLKQVHGDSHFALGGACRVGQTMESSSSVRVIEVKGAIVIDAGMGASGGKRQIAKVNGRRRNFR
jgi:hypothetical protein